MYKPLEQNIAKNISICHNNYTTIVVLLQVKKLAIDFYCEKSKNMLYFSEKEGETE